MTAGCDPRNRTIWPSNIVGVSPHSGEKKRRKKKKYIQKKKENQIRPSLGPAALAPQIHPAALLKYRTWPCSPLLHPLRAEPLTHTLPCCRRRGLLDMGRPVSFRGTVCRSVRPRTCRCSLSSTRRRPSEILDTSAQQRSYCVTEKRRWMLACISIRSLLHTGPTSACRSIIKPGTDCLGHTILLLTIPRTAR